MSSPSQTLSASDVLITTALKLTSCYSCKALTVKGHSLGFPVQIEPKLIPDLITELRDYRAVGKNTFELRSERGYLVADYRSLRDIEDGLQKPVPMLVGEHKCQEVISCNEPSF